LIAQTAQINKSQHSKESACVFFIVNCQLVGIHKRLSGNFWSLPDHIMERKIISHVCCFFLLTIYYIHSYSYILIFLQYIVIFYAITRINIAFLKKQHYFSIIVHLFHRIVLFTELILHYIKHFYSNYMYLLHIQITIR